jgi:DNA-binding transcriptional MerR regulator
VLNEQQTYSISDVAQALGVSTSYLRLAERLKLIPAARRTAGGHRRYTVKDVEELRLDGVGRRKRALAERGDG